MFGGKQHEETKELILSHKKDVDEKLDAIGNSVGDCQEQLSQLRKRLEEDLVKISWKTDENLEKINEDIKGIIKLSGEFSRSVASFDNLKNRLDDALYRRIQDIVDAELITVRKKMDEFKGIEQDFSQLVKEVNTLKGELSKFNTISHSIKAVDFTLQQHAKDLALADRKKIELERENEMLKTIMARMKRNDRKFVLK